MSIIQLRSISDSLSRLAQTLASLVHLELERRGGVPLACRVLVAVVFVAVRPPAAAHEAFPNPVHVAKRGRCAIESQDQRKRGK